LTPEEYCLTIKIKVMEKAEKDYVDVLNDFKEKIQATRTKALLSVNVQLLGLYWEIGNRLILQKSEKGWGGENC
jgi:hypothetical protein